MARDCGTYHTGSMVSTTRVAPPFQHKTYHHATTPRASPSTRDHGRGTRAAATSPPPHHERRCTTGTFFERTATTSNSGCSDDWSADAGSRNKRLELLRLCSRPAKKKKIPEWLSGTSVCSTVILLAVVASAKHRAAVNDFPPAADGNVSSPLLHCCCCCCQKESSFKFIEG